MLQPCASKQACVCEAHSEQSRSCTSWPPCSLAMESAQSCRAVPGSACTASQLHPHQANIYYAKSVLASTDHECMTVRMELPCNLQPSLSRYWKLRVAHQAVRRNMEQVTRRPLRRLWLL